MEMYISALVLSTTSHPNLKIYSAPVPNLKKKHSICTCSHSYTYSNHRAYAPANNYDLEWEVAMVTNTKAEPALLLWL